MKSSFVGRPDGPPPLLPRSLGCPGPAVGEELLEAPCDRLESRLTEEDEVVLARGEAQQLLEELKASGRRWISGTDARRPEPPKAEEPEPELEPEPRGWRFWRSR